MIAYALSAVIFAVCVVLVGLCVSDARKERLKSRGDILSAAEAAPKAKPRTRTGRALASAGLDMDARQFNILRFGGAAAVGLLALIAGGAVAALLVACAIIAGSEAALLLAARSRSKKFDEQLGRALPQIAETLRAGLTFDRALRSVANSAEDPLRSEFMRAAGEMAYNADLSAALEHMAARTKSRDVVLLTTVVKLGQERGGNIAPTLDTIAETIDKRLDMRRFIRSETAGNKLVMLIIIPIPFVLLLAMIASSPDYADFFLTTTGGWASIAVVVALEAIGTVVMNRMSNIKMD